MTAPLLPFFFAVTSLFALVATSWQAYIAAREEGLRLGPVYRALGALEEEEGHRLRHELRWWNFMRKRRSKKAARQAAATTLSAEEAGLVRLSEQKARAWSILVGGAMLANYCSIWQLFV